MYNLAIIKCTSPPLLAPRLKILKLKFTTPPGIEPRTFWIRGRHATICASAASFVPKCCPPTTVSYEEIHENHREPSPGGWWWVIKHFPSKTIQVPLRCSCSVRPSTVMKKDNIWGKYSSLLVLNKGIELQHALHIWRETIVLGMFTGSLRAQNWQVRCVAIVDILETLRNTSAQSYIWFSRSDLEIKK